MTRGSWAVAVVAMVAAVTLQARPARALSVSTAIPTNQKPYEIAVNPLTHRAYVVHDYDSTSPNLITIINTLTNTVITTLTVGHGNGFAAVNIGMNRAYVGSGNDSNIYVIDGNTNAIVDTVPACCGPNQIAVDEANNEFIVGTQNAPNSGGVVRVYNGANDQQICATGSLLYPQPVHGVAVDPANNRIYASIEIPGGAKGALVDEANCGVLATNLGTCGFGAGLQVVYSALDSRFWTTAFNTGQIGGYNSSTGAEERCVSTGGNGGFGTAITPDGSTLYSSMGTSGFTQLFKIDIASATVTGSLNPGIEMWGLGLDVQGCTVNVYAAAHNNSEVWVAQDTGAGPSFDPDCNNDTDFSNPGLGLPCVQDHTLDVNGDGYSESDELTPPGAPSCTGVFPAAGGLGLLPPLSPPALGAACPGRPPGSVAAKIARADVDVNGRVNILDLAAAASVYQQSGFALSPTDYRNEFDQNNDGVINILDLAAMAAQYNKAVPTC